MSLFGELKRRNVFRVAAAYLVTAWLLIEVSATHDDVPQNLQGALRQVIVLSDASRLTAWLDRGLRPAATARLLALMNSLRLT